VRNELKGKLAQGGFSLVSAIFLLVILAGLGAGMVTFSTAQNRSLQIDVMGARAYQAANAGIEWAAFNIATTPGLPAAAAQRFTPGTASALAGNLAPFAVTVGYTVSPPYIDELVAGAGVQNIWAYDITASAVYGTVGTTDYSERVVTAKIVQ
jgi:MSHA biogenesis protein MshP